MLTAFVALQDVDEQMGPTIFLPGTHVNLEALRAIKSPSKKAKFLRASSIRLGTMPTGSCTLYNTTLLHAGTSNNSPRSRWLFYMSFVPALRLVISNSIRDVYKTMCQLGVHSLGELERGNIRSQDDDETKRLTALWTDQVINDQDLNRLCDMWSQMT